MTSRDQFGNYVLFKKTGEDALGETFRAGTVGRQRIERIVLLRVYNGQGLDRPRLAEHLVAVGPPLQALRSPAIGLCTDLGEVRGVPFAAYEYLSGKNLGALLDQAARRDSPVTFDHALLIAERVALGAAVAYETRLGDERVLHGFLVPSLVMISNEGETRLLGFEAAGGVRGSVGHPLIKEAYGRYLAPEVASGAPRHKADDVYSLGAILYELLTGERLPAPGIDGFTSTIDRAVLTVEGTALPTEVADLLKRSLCPREQRIGDALVWHKTLSRLMADGHYNPTTFNLAFYMHGLFREEIEREAHDIEGEKTVQLTAEQLRQAIAPAAATAAAASPAPAKPAPASEGAHELREQFGVAPEPAAKKSVNPMMLAIAGAAVAVLAIGGYLLFGRSAPPPAAPVAASPGLTPEEIQAQIAAMVEEKLKSNDVNRAEAEKKIKELERQLEAAKRATPVSPDSRAAAARLPETTTRPIEPATAVATLAPPPAAAAQTPTIRATEPPTAAEAVKSVPMVPSPEPEPIAAPATASAPREVAVGDLVAMGPGVTPPHVVKRGVQRYPQAALRLSREATVTVRVLVDENGRVIQTDVPVRSGLGFDEAAVDTARGTTYSPATKGGVRVRMWTELKVAFALNR